MTKLNKKKKSIRRKAAAAATPHDEHNNVDCCDVDFTEHPATPDHELPGSKGGVE